MLTPEEFAAGGYPLAAAPVPPPRPPPGPPPGPRAPQQGGAMAAPSGAAPAEVAPAATAPGGAVSAAAASPAAGTAANASEAAAGPDGAAEMECGDRKGAGPTAVQLQHSPAAEAGALQPPMMPEGASSALCSAVGVHAAAAAGSGVTPPGAAGG